MDTDRLIGRTLGNFKLLSRLGQGGMGVVYLAEHQVLRNQAAVKVLPPNVAQNQQYRDRFFREARSAFALRHPNIVGVLDAGYDSDAGICYFAMELCEGRSLQDRLRDRGPMSLTEALPFFRVLAEAFYFAHAQGFIHRDIKPDNVMFDRDGVPKITDFGLARAEVEHTKLTATGQVMGTPAYMSLEQWEGEALDARADQYSLGVLFYEALTCRLPIEAPTAVSYLTKLVKGTRIPITSWRVDLPPPLIAIIERMTAIRVPGRYASLLEVRDDLAALGNGPTGAAAAARPTAATDPRGAGQPRTQIEPAGRPTQRAPSSRRRPMAPSSGATAAAPTVAAGRSMMPTRPPTRGSGRRPLAQPNAQTAGRSLSEQDIKTIVAQTRKSMFTQVSVVGGIVLVGAVVVALVLGFGGGGGGDNTNTANRDGTVRLSDLPNNGTDNINNEWANAVGNGANNSIANGNANTGGPSNTGNATATGSNNTNTANNGSANNGSANNGSANNGSANNGSANNVGPNNNAGSNANALNNAANNASTGNNTGSESASNNTANPDPAAFNGGRIDGAQTLRALPADGAYVIENQIEISEGSSLTLEAGATLMFNRDVGITCLGTLIIRGSENEDVSIHGAPNNDIYAPSAYIHLLGAGARATLLHASFYDTCGQRMSLDTSTLTLTIPGGATDPVFGGAVLVHDGATLEATHCGFYGCAAFNTRSDANRGGALMAFGRGGRAATVALRDCNFIGSYSTHGGGICLGSHVNASFDNCNLDTNECDSLGAGVYCEAYEPGHQSTFINCEFSGNEATLGGALMALGQPVITLRGCVLASNEAAAGGAIWAVGDPQNPVRVDVVGCSFDEHFVEAEGGAIGVEGVGRLTLRDTTFTGNIASVGGAIALLADEGSGPVIDAADCSFDSNGAQDSGGAICVVQGHGRIETCTFNENVAAFAGGAIAAGSLPGGEWLRVVDCEFNGDVSDEVGGAIALGDNARVEATQCRFNATSATEQGGAIAVAGSTGAGAELRIRDCEANDCYCDNADSHTMWVRTGNAFDRAQLRNNQFDEDEVVIED